MTPAPGVRQNRRAVAEPVLWWYRDLISCLQSTIGSLLLRAGLDPLEVLGAHWGFHFGPGRVRGEEFDYPARDPLDVGPALAPYHDLQVRWRTPAADAGPWEALAELTEQVARGHLPVAAVDNYHLGFRPAFQDVHAAHLVVVSGVDPARGLVWVSDAMPPAFKGPVPAEEFLRAWGSANPRTGTDGFFSGSGIGRRWFLVSVGHVPVPDARFVGYTIRADLRRWRGDDPYDPDDPDGGHWVGEPGLRRFGEALVDAARAGDGRAVEQAYPFGWGPQAQAALRAEWLRGWGVRHDVPAVREAARRVETVAHAWTGVRVAAAHGCAAPRAVADDLRRHVRVLREAYHAAAEALHEAEGSL